jgi:DcaP outer membrane protein
MCVRLWSALRLGLLLVMLCPALAWAQTSSSPAAIQPTTDAMLSELRKLVMDQRAILDAQAQRIEALEKSVAALKEQTGTTVAPEVEQRLAQIEKDVQRVPEMPAQAVSAGEFPGSMRIPGTKSAIKIGGQARMSLVNTFAALGTDDRFVTSSIPVGTGQEAGEEARVVYSPTASRFGIDLRTPFQRSTLRTFIEGDFAGNGNAFRLRHAFMQTNRWVVGQTWSTFSDPEAEPIGIDFEGLNAISLFRQAQIRYTHRLREQLQLALALENPAPDLTGAQGVNLTPDFIARVRWEPKVARTGLLHLSSAEHIQAAIIARQLRGEVTDQPQVTPSTGGFGVNVSGVVVPRWDRDDRIKFASNNGWGIGKYITDLGTLGGQDAVYDPTTGTLRALPVSSAYFGYERKWRPTIVSAFTYGIVNVSNLDIQPQNALQRTQRTTRSTSPGPPCPRPTLPPSSCSAPESTRTGRAGHPASFSLAGYTGSDDDRQSLDRFDFKHGSLRVSDVDLVADLDAFEVLPILDLACDRPAVGRLDGDRRQLLIDGEHFDRRSELPCDRRAWSPSAASAPHLIASGRRRIAWLSNVQYQRLGVGQLYLVADVQLVEPFHLRSHAKGILDALFVPNRYDPVGFVDRLNSRGGTHRSGLRHGLRKSERACGDERCHGTGHDASHGSSWLFCSHCSWPACATAVPCEPADSSCPKWGWPTKLRGLVEPGGVIGSSIRAIRGRKCDPWPGVKLAQADRPHARRPAWRDRRRRAHGAHDTDDCVR